MVGELSSVISNDMLQYETQRVGKEEEEDSECLHYSI